MTGPARAPLNCLSRSGPAPPLGMLVAVAAAYILRGPGGGTHGIRAAQGNLPDKAPG